MDAEAEAVIEWAGRYRGVIRLLTAAMEMFADCLLRNDISTIQTLGDRLPGLMKFVQAADVDAPTDPSQLASWNRLLSLVADLGIAASAMPRTETTIDIRPFGEVASQITDELNGMDELLRAARLVCGLD